MKARNFILSALCAMTFATAGVSSRLYADDMTKTPDIIGVATGEGMANVTTLVTLVKAAGLVETLQSKGPFTVFAPTNEAFAKLPKETVEMLTKPENKEKLKAILLYHVVAGNNDAKTVMAMKDAKSAEGTTIWIKEKDGKYFVGNDKGWAQIIKTDIHASNGTIHWIDSVIMP